MFWGVQLDEIVFEIETDSKRLKKSQAYESDIVELIAGRNG
jgi:hypothetical protein